MRRVFLVLLLVASAALNVALVVVFVRGARSPASAPPVVRATVVPRPAAPTLDASVWPGLQPDNLPALVTQLRQAGFPPRLLRAIVSAQVTPLFAARRKALDPDAETRPFWKNVNPDPKIALANRQLYREQEKLTRSLLGEDADGDALWEKLNHRRRFGELSPERTEQVRTIRERFDDQRMLLTSDGVYTPETRIKMAELEREQRVEIGKLLTPAELEEFDLFTSQTANSLRGRLTAFDATEQEFRAIYQLQRTFDEQFRVVTANPTDEQNRQREAAQKVLNEQIKSTLGPQRFTEYERATDYNYQQTARLMTRLDLPAESANEVWAVQKDMQQRAKTLRDDRTLTDEQRNPRLKALAAEASAKVASVIGARGLDAYKDNGGWWLVDLANPRPGR